MNTQACFWKNSCLCMNIQTCFGSGWGLRMNRYQTAIKITMYVIAGLTRNLQQINEIAGQARNDVVSNMIAAWYHS